jgi:hypothetical protein
MKDLDRREFTRLSLLAMLSGVTITVAGCGGGGGSPAGPSNPPPSGGDERGEITGNHGHTVTITSAQLTAGGALTLTLSPGTPEHVHTVDLSAAEITTIRGGGRVSKVSSTNDLHEHTVIFN